MPWPSLIRKGPRGPQWTKDQGLNCYNLEKKYEFIHYDPLMMAQKDQQLFDDQPGLLQKVLDNALALFNSDNRADQILTHKEQMHIWFLLI